MGPRFRRELYHRMVDVHKLNNLLWVWNQNGPATGGEFYAFIPARSTPISSATTITARSRPVLPRDSDDANGKPSGWAKSAFFRRRSF